MPGLNARAVATLAAALLAPAAVAVLRLFPPLSLSDPGAPSWLGPTVAGLASLAVGVAAALAVAAGLRRSTLAPLVEAAGLGSLAAGLAAGIFHALGDPASFPDGGLPIAAVVAGTGLLVSRLVPEVRLDTRARRMTLVGVAVVIEVALAVALFAPVEPAVAPWLTAAGAAMAAAACVPWPYLGPALLAGAFAALAAIRPGSLDAIPPLLAMLAGGVACTWERVVADRAAPVQPMALEPPALTTSLGPMQPSTQSRAADDEAMRLAHELRGTIEELMQSRRTIELQREELLRNASHDPLTGVATRRLVLERLAIEVAESRRYAHPVAAVLIDIDGFTRLNHDHGLAVGDDVLRELALRLRLRMRAADALGPRGRRQLPGHPAAHRRARGRRLLRRGPQPAGGAADHDRRRGADGGHLHRRRLHATRDGAQPGRAAGRRRRGAGLGAGGRWQPDRLRPDARPDAHRRAPVLRRAELVRRFRDGVDEATR